MKEVSVFSKGIASFCGIGYLGKGSGTVASLLTCLIWYLLKPEIAIQITIVLVITLIGIYSSFLVETEWGKDNQKVVIDEVAGMSITLLAIPFEPVYILSGLILFRFFDIVKPLFIRRMEYFKSGWGVMMDDVLAGVYSNILLQLIVYLSIQY
jgi:phosphatidylglycerophosphatase A